MDLEKILSGLSSEEARAHVVFQFLLGGVKVPPAEVLSVINWREERKEFRQAAVVAAEAGLWERAITACETTGDNLLAGIYAEKASLAASDPAEKITFAQRGVDNYLQVQRLDEALHLAEENDLHDAVIAIHVQRRQKEKAATYLLQKGMEQEAGELYEELIQEHHTAGRVREAASTALQAKMPERAVNLLQNAGLLLDAARTAQKEGLTTRAQALYGRALEIKIRDGETLDAARLSREAGWEDRALELYQRAIDDSKKKEEDPLETAKIAREGDLEEQARELYRGVAEKLKQQKTWTEREFSLTTKCFEEAGLPEQAIQMYLSWKRFTNAAETAQRAGMLERVVDIYEMAAVALHEKDAPYETLKTALDNAYAAARKAGVPRRAVEINERVGWLATAEEIALKEGVQDKIELYKALREIRERK